MRRMESGGERKGGEGEKRGRVGKGGEKGKGEW
jgi:hypothetical protein